MVWGFGPRTGEEQGWNKVKCLVFLEVTWNSSHCIIRCSTDQGGGARRFSILTPQKTVHRSTLHTLMSESWSWKEDFKECRKGFLQSSTQWCRLLNGNKKPQRMKKMMQTETRMNKLSRNVSSYAKCCETVLPVPALLILLTGFTPAPLLLCWEPIAAVPCAK